MGIATLCTQARVSVTDIKKTLWLCSKLMDWKKVKILVTTFWGTSIVSSGPPLQNTFIAFLRYYDNRDYRQEIRFLGWSLLQVSRA